MPINQGEDLWQTWSINNINHLNEAEPSSLDTSSSGRPRIAVLRFLTLMTCLIGNGQLRPLSVHNIRIAVLGSLTLMTCPIGNGQLRTPSVYNINDSGLCSAGSAITAKIKLNIWLGLDKQCICQEHDYLDGLCPLRWLPCLQVTGPVRKDKFWLKSKGRADSLSDVYFFWSSPHGDVDMCGLKTFLCFIC